GPSRRSRGPRSWCGRCVRTWTPRARTWPRWARPETDPRRRAAVTETRSNAQPDASVIVAVMKKPGRGAGRGPSGLLYSRVAPDPQGSHHTRFPTRPDPRGQGRALTPIRSQSLDADQGTKTG